MDKLISSPSLQRGQRHCGEQWEGLETETRSRKVELRSELHASWHRSHQYGVDRQQRHAPLDARRLLDARGRYHELICAAGPVIRETADLLRQAGGIVVLCAPDGIILDVAGATRTVDLGLEFNIAPGGIWAEQISGTNAVGTAICEKRALQVQGAEHYCDSIRHWTCAAGLLFDPLDGHALGVLDISYVDVRSDLHALPLAVFAARRIETELLTLELLRQQFVLYRYAETCNHYSTDGIVALDRHGRLLAWNERGAALIKACSPDARLVRGAPFDPHIERLGAAAHESLSLQQEHAGDLLIMTSNGSCRLPAMAIQPSPNPTRYAPKASSGSLSTRPAARDPGIQPIPGGTLRLRDAERHTILTALQAEGGSRSRAASRLGISRTTLYRRLVAYGLGGDCDDET